MRDSQLRRFLRKGRKMKCARCPIPQRTCNAISKGLWGEEKCLLRVVLREILAFHTEEHKRMPLLVSEGVIKSLKGAILRK